MRKEPGGLETYVPFRALLAVFVLAVFVIVTNGSMTDAAAHPTIGEEFGASQAQAGWAITSHLLVFVVGVVPLYGRLSVFLARTPPPTTARVRRRRGLFLPGVTESLMLYASSSPGRHEASHPGALGGSGEQEKARGLRSGSSILRRVWILRACRCCVR